MKKSSGEIKQEASTQCGAAFAFFAGLHIFILILTEWQKVSKSLVKMIRRMWRRKLNLKETLLFKPNFTNYVSGCLEQNR